MNETTPVIEVRNLVRHYRHSEAVRGLNLRVEPGRCYGLFGRNGAGKTTTIKCLLDLLRPAAGSVRLFGLDPHIEELAVKRRLAFVPDNVAFYPWMSVRQWFDYLASFREKWNEKLERELTGRFEINLNQKAETLSRGQKMQVALIGALCPEPELLILDEPTSGLDPMVRREFIRTVIGTYQEADPGRRTVFVSTHLITEFEGLIDEFTVMDKGRDIVTMATDDARRMYRKLRARFAGKVPALDQVPGWMPQVEGRELEICVNGEHDAAIRRLHQLGAEHIEEENLSLEEIFLVTLNQKQAAK